MSTKRNEYDSDESKLASLVAPRPFPASHRRWSDQAAGTASTSVLRLPDTCRYVGGSNKNMQFGVGLGVGA